MPVLRAFVLGVNSRAALAVAIVALSVAYAVMTGAAANGLSDASATLGADLLSPRAILARPDLAPFPDGQAPEGSTLLTHGRLEGMTLGTLRPWTLGTNATPGLYARPLEEPLRSHGLVLGQAAAVDGAPGDWVLVPPQEFFRLFPELAGRSTLALAPFPSAGNGDLQAFVVPAGGAFYRAGAAQVFDSVHLVVAAVGLIVAVLAGGVLRLEVLARQADLATLETFGGRNLVRQTVVLRSLVLVGSGVVLGGLSGALGVEVAGRALGSVDLRADPLLVLEAMAVAFVAGFLAGTAGGLWDLRTSLSSRLGRRGLTTRRFPGPVRFLLVTPRVGWTAFASAFVLTAVTSVVFAAATIPVSLFDQGEGNLVLGQSAGNPFRGSAERHFGERATMFAGINASSPETLAPTVIDGAPVIVRGIQFEGWRSMTPASLVTGRWPEVPGEATVGARAAVVLGLGVGDTVVVPGAYRPTLRVLQVVGIHAAQDLYDDEILTDLDPAGDLAGLPPAAVHLVRVEATREAVDAALTGNRLLVTDVNVAPSSPVPLTTAVAQASLVNVGSTEASRQLTLRVNGLILGSQTLHVAPGVTTVVAFPFTVPDTEELVVTINPTTTVPTAAPTLTVEVPETVAANTSFGVRVISRAGEPVQGALVVAEDQRILTDSEGNATLRAEASGSLLVSVQQGALQGGAIVYVVEPEWALSPRLHADQAVILSSRFGPGNEILYRLAVTVTNLGGAAFDDLVEVTLGDRSVGNASASVGVRARATVEVEISVPRGAEGVHVAGLIVPLPDLTDSSLPAEVRPRTVAEILAAKQAARERFGATRELSGEAFLEDVFRNLEPTVVLVVLATFLHAGAALVVAVLRELRERADISTTLAHLGASPDLLALRGARDALLATLPGIVLGTAAAVGLFQWLQPQGFPAAFGHTLLVRFDAVSLGQLVGGLLLVAVATGAVAAQGRPDQPLRQVPLRPLQDLLEVRR